MTIHRFANNQKGFSLLFIISLVAAVGIIALGAAILSVRLQKTSEERVTMQRMLVVRDSIKAYYRGHQKVLTPEPTPPNSIPVEAVSLNLEQKYRLDAWGQYFHYYHENDIVGIEVDDKKVAAVLISAGPNQTFDSF
ncbi:MAG: type II secretion system protein, partial [Deltaproteobacteria bacterium]|nr:type II secretion system protein [Deltaproteobacteria bacterium]